MNELVAVVTCLGALCSVIYGLMYRRAERLRVDGLYTIRNFQEAKDRAEQRWLWARAFLSKVLGGHEEWVAVSAERPLLGLEHWSLSHIDTATEQELHVATAALQSIDVQVHLESRPAGRWVVRLTGGKDSAICAVDEDLLANLDLVDVAGLVAANLVNKLAELHRGVGPTFSIKEHRR